MGKGLIIAAVLLCVASRPMPRFVTVTIGPPSRSAIRCGDPSNPENACLISMTAILTPLR